MKKTFKFSNYIPNKYTLAEDIEKHDSLNPLLWNSDNTLKPEVEEKINLIVEEFLDGLKEDEVSVEVKDIKLVGSNCSYNYTKDSDLDIHIECDTKSLECPEDLYAKLYSAYRSIFNNKLDIDFYGIPVEIYVETEESTVNSNGIYSVMAQKWLKEPTVESIPEIDQDAINDAFKPWEERYNDIMNKAEAEGLSAVKDLQENFVGTISEVIELPDFTDNYEELGIDKKFIEIAKQEIIKNPNVGDVIQGGNGARKMRIAIDDNSGKSGGARIAYINYYVKEIAYLINIIKKSDQANFTKKQIKQIAKTVDFIKDDA